MKISILLAHPDLKSFNHAIARTAAKTLATTGHTATLHDLYHEKFDPLLSRPELARNPQLDETIARHCREITSADGIVIVHPNWWGMPPAILKGWIDRVLRMDIAYRFVPGDHGEGVPVPLLRAQSAIVFNTSNTPDDRERATFGDPLELLWKNCVFGLCGPRHVLRRNFSVVVTSTLEQRTRWLDEVRELVRQTFPATCSAPAH